MNKDVRIIFRIILYIIFGLVCISGLAKAKSPSNTVSESNDESISISKPVVSTANPGCNLANYYILERGMSYSNVTAVLGPGTEMFRVELPESPVIIMYEWKNCLGDLGANMTVRFHDDQLIVKSQYGLK